MAPTAMKRARDDGEYTSSPDFKKARSQLSDTQSESGEAQQAKLVIETSIAELGDLSKW